jgi:hypothetical protein
LYNLHQATRYIFNCVKYQENIDYGLCQNSIKIQTKELELSENDLKQDAKKSLKITPLEDTRLSLVRETIEKEGSNLSLKYYAK